ncbi:protein of unknown function [Blastococcus saxobsidens DD2]|uniref:Uncharacterized protein n=1 Tax=Blastococcus saxobsidens (strain DD2) TaxID=1146883 RepID=H6RUA8_BLASD|nr:protein of unknown function [Blastococcus saxobsidens DD2]
MTPNTASPSAARVVAGTVGNLIGRFGSGLPLVQLDVDTGRLRWVNAGHPSRSSCAAPDLAGPSPVLVAGVGIAAASAADHWSFASWDLAKVLAGPGKDPPVYRMKDPSARTESWYLCIDRGGPIRISQLPVIPEL